MIEMKQLIVILLAGVMIACDDLTSVEPSVTPETGLSSGALYVLCDGNYSLNNSTLALYNAVDGRLERDFFQSVAGRKLGDTGNDMQRHVVPCGDSCEPG